MIGFFSDPELSKCADPAVDTEAEDTAVEPAPQWPKPIVAADDF
jgi:hypothetical protein